MEQLDREHIWSLMGERARAVRDDFDVTRFSNQYEATGYYTGRIEEFCAQNAIDQSEVIALAASFMVSSKPGREGERRSRVIIEFGCHDAAEVSILERLVQLGYTDVRVERVERVER